MDTYEFKFTSGGFQAAVSTQHTLAWLNDRVRTPCAGGCNRAGRRARNACWSIVEGQMFVESAGKPPREAAGGLA